METQQIAAVFDEWARQYAEHPESFDGEIIDQSTGRPIVDYGPRAARTFLQIADELFPVGPHWIWGRAECNDEPAPVCSECDMAVNPIRMKQHQAECWQPMKVQENTEETDAANRKQQTESVIECMNSAFNADPEAIHALLVNYVPCNADLADHPFIQVGTNPVLERGFQVGALGLINGVLQSAGLPIFCPLWSAPGDDGRRKLMGFVEYQPEESLPVAQ